MFSSGDGGVGGGDCLTNDGKNKTVFQPLFPSTCTSPPPPPFQSHSFSPHLAKFIPGPFVTAVGGTVNVTEQAVFFSGGGFSRLFPQPSYQKTAVKGFLKSLGSEFKGLFNAGGRGYPDVAAQGLK